MQQLCDGGGVRASPTDDELRNFVAAAATLDGTFLATALQVGRCPVAPLSTSPPVTPRRRCDPRGRCCAFSNPGDNVVFRLFSQPCGWLCKNVTRCCPPQPRSPHC